eukprot:g68919.t1
MSAALRSRSGRTLLQPPRARRQPLRRSCPRSVGPLQPARAGPSGPAGPAIRGFAVSSDTTLSDPVQVERAEKALPMDQREEEEGEEKQTNMENMQISDTDEWEEGEVEDQEKDVQEEDEEKETYFWERKVAPKASSYRKITDDERRAIERLLASYESPSGDDVKPRQEMPYHEYVDKEFFGRKKSAQAFKDLGLQSWLWSKLHWLKWKEPTSVQALALPLLLQPSPPDRPPNDLLIQAQTGTGKTGAYILPMLHLIQRDSATLQGIVIVPSRELGIQVYMVASTLVKGGSKEFKKHPILVSRFLGHNTPTAQAAQLQEKPSHILIVTPNALKVLLKRKALDVSHLKLVVIDEVDFIFRTNYSHTPLGLLDRMYGAQKRTRKGRSRLVFVSAFISDEVLQVARKVMHAPKVITSDGLFEPSKDGEMTALEALGTQQNLPRWIEHYSLSTPHHPLERCRELRRLFAAVKPRVMLVFMNECSAEFSQLILQSFINRGFRAALLVRATDKRDRLKAIEACRNRRLDVLIASEMVARGLDIPNITHVISAASSFWFPPTMVLPRRVPGARPVVPEEILPPPFAPLEDERGVRSNHPSYQHAAQDENLLKVVCSGVNADMSHGTKTVATDGFLILPEPAYHRVGQGWLTRSGMRIFCGLGFWTRAPPHPSLAPLTGNSWKVNFQLAADEVNFQLAADEVSYSHRAGRVGRLQGLQPCSVVTLVSSEPELALSEQAALSATAQKLAIKLQPARLERGHFLVPSGRSGAREKGLTGKRKREESRITSVANAALRTLYKGKRGGDWDTATALDMSFPLEEERYQLTTVQRRGNVVQGESHEGKENENEEEESVRREVSQTRKDREETEVRSPSTMKQSTPSVADKRARTRLKEAVERLR